MTNLHRARMLSLSVSLPLGAAIGDAFTHGRWLWVGVLIASYLGVLAAYCELARASSPVL